MSISILARYIVLATCVVFTLATLPLLGDRQWLWVWPFTLFTGGLVLGYGSARQL
jgi:hypothetical protein